MRRIHHSSRFIEMLGGNRTSAKWPKAKLAEIVDPDCPISYGIVQPDDDVKDGVPIVRPVDLNAGLYIKKEGLKCTKPDISNAYKRTVLRGEELLLCVRGTTGLMGIATEELKGANVTRGITPLFFKHGINRFYILGAFLSDEIQSYIKEHTIGSTLKGINMEEVRKIEFPVPPIILQNKYEQIFKQADKSKFSDFKSRFIEMFGAPNSNPLGILTGLVSDIFTLQMGKTPARDTARYWAKDGSGNKWISIADMSQYEYFTEDTEEYISDSAVKETGMKLIPEQTVIMSFKLTIGRVSVTSEPIFSNEAIVAFIPRVHVYNTRFLYYLVKFYDWLENAALAVKGKTLNKDSIGKNRLIIPSIESQNEFASFAEQADKSKYMN